MNNFKLLLYLLPLQLPNLWAIWHAYSHQFKTPLQRVLWICAGIFLPCIGGILYFFFGRNKIIGRG